MPAIANKAITKNDNVTAITFTAVTPSSGDRSPAVWQSQTVGTAFSHRPTMTMTFRDNGNGSGRRCDIRIVYPQIATNSTTGVTSIINKVVWDISALFPKDMAAADINEAVSQACKLLGLAGTITEIQSMYAPT